MAASGTNSPSTIAVSNSCWWVKPIDSSCFARCGATNGVWRAQTRNFPSKLQVTSAGQNGIKKSMPIMGTDESVSRSSSVVFFNESQTNNLPCAWRNQWEQFGCNDMSNLTSPDANIPFVRLIAMDRIAHLCFAENHISSIVFVNILSTPTTSPVIK